MRREAMTRRHKRRTSAVAMPRAVNDGLGGRPDYGDDLGPAMLARPSAIEPVGGEYRSVGETRVEARRCQDATLYDRMHAVGQLSDRQHATAARLARMWHAAGLEASVTGSYDEHVDGRGPESDAEDVTAQDRYHALMRGRRGAELLDAMLCGQHPGWRLPQLQAALDDLAREWGMTHDY